MLMRGVIFTIASLAALYGGSYAEYKIPSDAWYKEPTMCALIAFTTVAIFFSVLAWVNFYMCGNSKN